MALALASNLRICKGLLNHDHLTGVGIDFRDKQKLMISPLGRLKPVRYKSLFLYLEIVAECLAGIRIGSRYGSR